MKSVRTQVDGLIGRLRRYAYNPKSRVAFWQKKFADNKKRDASVAKLLKKIGWKVLVIWECAIEKNPDSVARHLCRHL
jgi:DNA mismatch endonuclease (patch repair protein)